MAYFCSPYARVPISTVEPHVPDRAVWTPPPRYAIIHHYRGLQTVPVIQQVEPDGRGSWRVWTNLGWLILSDAQVWESVDAAVDELFRRNTGGPERAAIVPGEAGPCCAGCGARVGFGHAYLISFIDGRSSRCSKCPP